MYLSTIVFETFCIHLYINERNRCSVVEYIIDSGVALVIITTGICVLRICFIFIFFFFGHRHDEKRFIGEKQFIILCVCNAPPSYRRKTAIFVTPSSHNTYTHIRIRPRGVSINVVTNIV